MSKEGDQFAFFTHPLPMAAVALTALNDHWLKYRFPGFLTGKISDFSGVFYFPIFLLALEVMLCRLEPLKRLQKSIRTKENLLLLILFTDLLMVIVKLHAPSARAIEHFFAAYFFKIQLTQDPTDLIAFAVNPLTYVFVKRRMN